MSNSKRTIYYPPHLTDKLSKVQKLAQCITTKRLSDLTPKTLVEGGGWPVSLLGVWC